MMNFTSSPKSRIDSINDGQMQSTDSSNLTRQQTSTSRSLLVRVKGLEQEAWNRLVELYAPLVYHWCRKSGAPPQDVPDIVQDVFQAVYGTIGRFSKTRESDTFRGWMRVITRRKVVDHYRRKQQEPFAAGGTDANFRWSQVPESPDSQTETDQTEEDSSRRVLFRRALELIRPQFSEQSWQAFWRTTVDQQSSAAVGEELGMKPGAVRVAKYRVLQRLRAELGDLIELDQPLDEDPCDA